MSWKNCKNILCVRPDNMGDLIMSGPAIRALKQSFNARITVLTSSMAAGVARSMPEIDEVIIFDVPWVKSSLNADRDDLQQTVEYLKGRNFDAAVIFTVFSQNPLPTAMLVYMAGIPRVLAYCRENPYQLINHWVPECEPHQYINHQVERDLKLVASIGADTTDNRLALNIQHHLWPVVEQRLQQHHVDLSSPWLIIHPGVSEKKREYPLYKWTEAGKLLIEKGYQVIITGASAESHLTNELAAAIGSGSLSAGGLFNLDEFICLIAHAPVLLSVNTGSVHIAAAVQTPVVVLYAETNPQHTPWQVNNIVLSYSIPHEQRSKNQIIASLYNSVYCNNSPLPDAAQIVDAALSLLTAPEVIDDNSIDHTII